MNQQRRENADQWWDDGEDFEENRGDLSQISDLYCCWDAQVNVEDLNHSVSVDVGDLKNQSNNLSVKLKQQDIKLSCQ